MITAYREYKTIRDFVSEKTKKVCSVKATINLFDIKSWEETDNEEAGFFDNIKRTFIIEKSGAGTDIRVSYDEFTKIMESLYSEYGLLDRQSLKKSDRQIYSGPIKVNFSSQPDKLSVTFHRKGFQPRSFEDAVFNCLFSNVTPMN
jgi:hypothetical protein